MRSIVQLLPFAALLVVFALGARLDVMDVDAAQYASIAKEMLETGSYLQVYNRGVDYLDKPPLLFWLTAFSFSVFGINNFAYRLPAILFSLLAAFAAYRFTRMYYSAQAAYLSALVLLSCQAFILMNHDVRTDGILAGSVMLAIWQLAAYLQQKRLIYLVGGFVGVGLAMLAKGPIGLIVPAAAFTVDFILKRQWGNFFKWQWLVGAGIVALLLLPMCIGLYQQFDLHPEKVVNYKTGQSGLRFYFWTQSFGRITGENDWNNNVSLTFQAENFLWSFLPWTFLFIPALWFAFRQIVRQGFLLNPRQEAIALGGFVLPFLMVSTSKYQLPHYSYVVFPLAAILTGVYMDKILTDNYLRRWFQVSRALQYFTVSVVWLLGFVLALWAFPMQAWVLWVGGVWLLLGCAWAMGLSRNPYHQLVTTGWLSIVGVNLWLNAHIYPTLFQYQTGSVVAKYIRRQPDIPIERVYVYKAHWHSIDFYSRKNTQWLHDASMLPEITQTGGPCLVYTDSTGLAEIKALPKPTVEVLKTYNRFHISSLTPEFLNPATRQKACNSVYLVRVGGNLAKP